MLGPDGSIVAGPDKRADEVTAADFSDNPLRPVAELVGRRLAAATASARVLRRTRRERRRRLPSRSHADRFPRLADRRRHSGAGISRRGRSRNDPARDRPRTVRPRRRADLRIRLTPAHRAVRSVPLPGTWRLWRASTSIGSPTARRASRNWTRCHPRWCGWLPDLPPSEVPSEGRGADARRARRGGQARRRAKPLTILFADIAGFTGLSERLGDNIVPLIGAYLDLCRLASTAHRGTVDKFIGDAVMAFWGAPRQIPTTRSTPAAPRSPASGRSGRRALVDDYGRSALRPDRHQLRHRGRRQCRLREPAELHRARRHGEPRQPAGRHQQDLRHHHHHRRRDAAAGGRAHRRARGRPDRRLWPHRAVRRSTSCSGSQERKPTRRWIAVYETGLAHYRAREWSEALSCFERAAQ